MNRNYPKKSTIKLVGDKYRLSRQERSILYRGISDSKTALERRSKVVREIVQGPVYIDTYNVMFVMANYILGRSVYLSDDGVLRDAGEMHGRFSNKKILQRIQEILEEFVSGKVGLTFRFILDEPVSNSGRLSAELNAFFRQHRLEAEARTMASPDYFLSQIVKGTVCSGDSVIMDNTGAQIFDLPLYLLTKHFDIQPPVLNELR